jgi:hypothetical protein
MSRSPLLLTLVALAMGWVSDAEAAKSLSEADLAKCEALLSGLEPGQVADAEQVQCLSLLRDLGVLARANTSTNSGPPHNNDDAGANEPH